MLLAVVSLRIGGGGEVESYDADDVVSFDSVELQRLIMSPANNLGKYAANKPQHLDNMSQHLVGACILTLRISRGPLGPGARQAPKPQREYLNVTKMYLRVPGAFAATSWRIFCLTARKQVRPIFRANQRAIVRFHHKGAPLCVSVPKLIDRSNSRLPSRQATLPRQSVIRVKHTVRPPDHHHPTPPPPPPPAALPLFKDLLGDKSISLL